VGTTYVPTTNQPTNQPPTMSEVEVVEEPQDTLPVSYLSLRVTRPHSDWDQIVTTLHDCEWLAWPHSGKGNDNPHYHIIIPSSDPKAVERHRKRIKTLFKDGGNGLVSCKLLTNGVHSAITYCAKEGTKALHSHAHHAAWIESAPVWVDSSKNIGASLLKRPIRELNPEHFRQISYRNLEKSTLLYRQRHGIKSKRLEDVLAAMHKDNYRLDVSVLRNGIPSIFYDQFEAACDGTTIFTPGKFTMMRRIEPWVHNA